MFGIFVLSASFSQDLAAEGMCADVKRGEWTVAMAEMSEGSLLRVSTVVGLDFNTLYLELRNKKLIDSIDTDRNMHIHSSHSPIFWEAFCALTAKVWDAQDELEEAEEASVLEVRTGELQRTLLSRSPSMFAADLIEENEQLRKKLSQLEEQQREELASKDFEGAAMEERLARLEQMMEQMVSAVQQGCQVSLFLSFSSQWWSISQLPDLVLVW